ncbi:MAG: serine hydrolase domain-containing protein [Deltaproteobacteria bacterium]|nr:serine hydrolase domain-containing protein [Deltaproteobacteria bacterium]
MTAWGEQAFPNLRHVADEAIACGVVPGMAVCVSHGHAKTTCNFGRVYGDAASAPVTPVSDATVYDLASLTKALATSLLAMRAVATCDASKFDLALPVTRWLPRAPKGVTVEHLLSHTSGWPAHAKFYEQLLPQVHPGDPAPALRSALIEQLQNTPLQALPGARSVYSDLGFIALGHILELVLEQRLDVAFERQIALPLQLRSLRFGVDPAQISNVAPTEDCAWRGRLLVGQVHDQNAWLMGGVAGHAGLFGTAHDVAALLASLLRSHADAPQPDDPIEPAILQRFWAFEAPPPSTWALGWDRPSPGASLAGRLIDRRAVGHLAFTGCSVWVDPRRQTFVVMLSNRVHPVVRDDARFRALRPAVMDAALTDLHYGV